MHFDIFAQLLQLLQSLIMPDWNDLIRGSGLIPLLLILVLAGWLGFVAWQWWKAIGRTGPRQIPRFAGAPPPGVHVSAPSYWTAVVAAGAFLILLGLVLVTTSRLAPFNVLILVLGLLTALVAVFGWLRDAMSEWRRTAMAAEVAPAPVAAPVAVPELAESSAATASVPATMALVPVGEVVPASSAEPAGPPPGVHVSAPSPWPFFAPIALMVIFFGLVFSPILMAGGVVLGVIAAGGWLRDAMKEWSTTEAVGHAAPETLDPGRVWPGRLIFVFAGIVGLCLVLLAAPTVLNGVIGALKPATASPTPVAVPAQPEISASSAISFDTKTLVVPAGRAFTLIFHNKNAGVPHNVRIASGADMATIFFDGQPITGVADATYQVPALKPGNYFFECKIHPNMNGTVQAVTESGSGAGSSPGSSPGSSSSP